MLSPQRSRVGGCNLLLEKREREKVMSERDGIVRRGRRLGSSVFVVVDDDDDATVVCFYGIWSWRVMVWCGMRNFVF